MAGVIEVSLPHARVAFTARTGGVSGGPFESLNLGILTDDDRDAVRRNRDIVSERIGIPRERVVIGRQVHGTELREWDRPPKPGAPLAPVDGHLTSATGLALLVLVADCLPVALASQARVAMVHCGWRGLAGGIVERALAAFAGETVTAAVGPGIGRCHFEVGDEVLSAFADHPDAADGRMLDLRAIADAKLRAGGVDVVEHVDRCTFCEPGAFFSHRRDGGVTGRQAGIAWRAA